MHPAPYTLITALVLVLALTGALAQTIVPVGSGSYASFPPPADTACVNVNNMTLHVINQAGRPIPTNNWDTDLFVNGQTDNAELWALPLMAKMTTAGTALYAGNHPTAGGNDSIRANPLQLSGTGFTPTDTNVVDWGDWTTHYRVQASGTQYYDVTIGHGLPCTWVQYTGVTPVIQTTGATTYFDATGKAGVPTAPGDTLGIVNGGNTWAVFAPDNTTFTVAGANITVTFAGASQYLVFALLTSVADLPTFHQYAFAMPTNTVLSWVYDQTAGTITQTWTVTTQILKGTEPGVIQGWIPHHYRTTTLDFPFTGITYTSPRGPIKTATGTVFHITYNFPGFLPFAPAADALASDAKFGQHPYLPARMAQYESNYATGRTTYRDDTYWGGKDLLQWGQYMNFAAQIGDPTLATQEAHLKAALTDWYTYTPGEAAHYFMYYPNWGSLVGWNVSYGSEEFNDHHFHYGYFTMATAYLGLQDPAWLAQYGPMARLLAKDYANWDHSDTMFPFMRTWDPWEGHAWASGVSSATGCNEESSSEGMQAWGGMFLLGAAMGDNEMMAAGAMGWCCESQAVLEYWYNHGGDVFPASYPHPMSGQAWSAGINWGTWFSGDPAWVYGIQLMPNSPALEFYDEDPGFTRKMWEEMFNISRNVKADAPTISAMGTGLGNVMLAHATYFDPDWVCQIMDTLYANGDPVATDVDTPGITYFTAHVMRALGYVQFNYHMSLPMAGVYYNPSTKVYTYAAQNPAATPATVTVYQGTTPIGTFTATPNTLTAVHTLSPP